jgi:uncharacterized RDD family membrane protein YckC
MNVIANIRTLLLVLLVGGVVGLADVHAQELPPAPPGQPAATEVPEDEVDDVEAADPDVDRDERPRRRHRRGSRSGNEIVSVGHDSMLPAGERAEVVVSIFGSSTVDGEVDDSVVSILGDSRVSGPVGDTVVAVMGDVYVNSRVGGEVVSVMGKVELGPEARVDGELISVFGEGILRHPSAEVRGGVKEVMRGVMGGLRPWIEHCFLYARPLALQPGLGWAWTAALGVLAFYVLLGLMFREQVEQCVQTFEEHPGHSLLTALLAVLLTPVLFVVLAITVVGVAVIPFLALGVLAATAFGKAVVLAWLGRRCIRSYGPTALAVAIGGIIMLALYVVPVVGFIALMLFGMIGLGIVVYTILLNLKASRQKPVAASVGPVSQASIAPEPGEPAFTAGAASGAQVAPNAQPAPPVAAVALPRASFWIRMGALLIDAVLVGIVASIVFGGIDVGDMDPFLPLLAAYGAVMWKLRGTTVGGIICNLQVVRLDGREIDWPTVVVRALSCFLSLVVAGLGFLWMLFDDERQTWHDKIAGTVVVRVPKGTPLL